VKPLIVGIAGGSGSGKSTLAAALVRSLEPDCLHLVHDRYYRGLTSEQLKDPLAVNLDHPDALETERLISDLASLQETGRAQVPVYDFPTYRRVREEWVTARSVVLVEGILTFVDPTLCALMDFRVFVDASDEVRLNRRVRRDVAERGRTEEEVRARFADTVRPMHERFVEPTYELAHLVVDGTATLAASVAEVLTHIKALGSVPRR